jgi:hypothetical protein
LLLSKFRVQCVQQQQQKRKPQQVLRRKSNQNLWFWENIRGCSNGQPLFLYPLSRM